MKYASLEDAREAWNPTHDLGNGHWMSFVSWKPDRKLNPQYDGIPDVEKYGLIYIHPCHDGKGYCCGSIAFDNEVSRTIESGRPRWKVESWEPFTISPSLLCRTCNSHGFIRDGKWVDA